MPNWCDNLMRVRHMNPQALERVIEACNSKGLFDFFRPMPDDLRGTTSGGLWDEEEQHLNEIKTRANVKKHGYMNWYDWSVDNWGTKWDANDVSCKRIADDELQICFCTAWAPPLAWYDFMCMLGYEIDAFYVETGMYFCGAWRNGEDEDYSLEDVSQIPEDIKDAFPFVFAPDEEIEYLDEIPCSPEGAKNEHSGNPNKKAEGE